MFGGCCCKQTEDTTFNPSIPENINSDDSCIPYDPAYDHNFIHSINGIGIPVIQVHFVHNRHYDAYSVSFNKLLKSHGIKIEDCNRHPTSKTAIDLFLKNRDKLKDVQYVPKPHC